MTFKQLEQGMEFKKQIDDLQAIFNIAQNAQLRPTLEVWAPTGRAEGDVVSHAIPLYFNKTLCDKFIAFLSSEIQRLQDEIEQI